MNELMMDYAMPRDTLVSGTFDRALTGDIESGWRARLVNFEMPPSPAPGQLALDRIELEVWWASGNDHRTFTLDAYRSRVLRPGDVAVGAPQ